MTTGETTTNPGDAPTWRDLHEAGIATLAFGNDGDGRTLDLTRLRHLALLPANSLELDLSDPEQRRLGDYELLELIGEGGMGIVYRARHLSLDREVALKLLAAGPWASRDFVERFRREAQNAARMQHPNIVAIHEVGATEDLHFFSMRLVRGRSVAVAIRDEHRFEPRRAVQLMRTVAEAVAYAHSLGVLHLDLKPANILLDEDGTPHVADFGLARRLDSALALDNEEISGTPAYMAPEQAELHTHKISAATDIWGLGAVLYELLTGQPPFQAPDAQALLRLVCEGRVRAPRRLVPQLPADLDAVVLKCLAHDPARRYASARALADDLGCFLERREVRARALNVVQRLGRWVRREPRLAAAIGAVFVALGTGLAAATVQWRHAQANAEHTRATRDFLVGIFEEANPDENGGRPMTAHELLDRGERRIERHALADAEVRTDLLGVLGKLYWDIGDYPRAESLLQQAIDGARHAHVGDATQARLLLDQASVENEQNKYAAAIDNATRSLQLSDGNGESGAADANEARRQIAQAKIGDGHTADAEALLRTTLADDRRRLGPGSREVADDEILLGHALLEQSRLDESIAATREAIAAAEKAYGPENGHVLDAMGNLAVALRTKGRYEDAEATLREAVRIATALYGPDHATTLSARSNLLVVMDSEGRSAEALEERLSMLPVQARLAADHPEILAYAWKNIAGEQLYLGRFADAQASAEKALAVWKNLEGSDSEWHSVAARQSLAQALQFRGRYADAEEVLRETLDIQRRHEPPGSVWLNQTRTLLGSLLRAEHHADAARRELESALATLPAGASPIRAQILTQTSLAALEGGNAATARETGETALAMARETYPPGNAALAGPLCALARADLATGHAAEAEPLLHEALALRGKDHPADDPRTLDVEVAFANTLAALGRTEEARSLRGRIEPVLRSQHTPCATDLLARLTHG